MIIEKNGDVITSQARQDVPKRDFRSSAIVGCQNQVMCPLHDVIWQPAKPSISNFDKKNAPLSSWMTTSRCYGNVGQPPRVVLLASVSEPDNKWDPSSEMKMRSRWGEREEFVSTERGEIETKRDGQAANEGKVCVLTNETFVKFTKFGSFVSCGLLDKADHTQGYVTYGNTDMCNVHVN